MKHELSGPDCALCALSFFRHRHDRRPRYKNPSKKSNREKTVSNFSSYSQIIREYIQEAREKGFKGKVVIP